LARRAGGTALMFVSLACLIWSWSIPSSRSPRCDLAHAMRYEIWNQRFIPSTTVVSGPDLVNRAGSRHGPPLTKLLGPGGPSREQPRTWLESARHSAHFCRLRFCFGAQGRKLHFARNNPPRNSRSRDQSQQDTRACSPLRKTVPNGLTGAIDSKDGRANHRTEHA
jgi:hypothetical protein